MRQLKPRHLSAKKTSFNLIICLLSPNFTTSTIVTNQRAIFHAQQETWRSKKIRVILLVQSGERGILSLVDDRLGSNLWSVLSVSQGLFSNVSQVSKNVDSFTHITDAQTAFTNTSSYLNDYRNYRSIVNVSKTI